MMIEREGRSNKQ